MRQFPVYVVFCVVFIFFITIPAFAHKPIVNAWTEGAEVMVEGAFSDGSTAKQAAITVYDPQGEVLLTGKTDDAGLFSFPVSRKVDMRIEMNAGMGHVAETDIPADDISFLAAEDSSVGREAPPDASTPVAIEGEMLSKQDVQLIVDKSLKKQLRPVFEQLEARKLTDILSGIGYIIGLVGMAAYVNSRKKHNSRA